MEVKNNLKIIRGLKEATNFKKYVHFITFTIHQYRPDAFLFQSKLNSFDSFTDIANVEHVILDRIFSGTKLS